MPNPIPAPALAQLSDVEARMPRALTSEEQTLCTALLSDASAAARAFTHQYFSLETTTERIRPVDQEIQLPELPVVSVNSLARVDIMGNGTIPYAIWAFDGLDTILLGPVSQIVNLPAILIDQSWIYRSVMYEINYTHGYSTIPDDVVGVVAGAVVRVLLGPQPGVVGETIGGYSYRVVDGYRPGLISLTPEDKDVLKRYRGRRNRTIEAG